MAQASDASAQHSHSTPSNSIVDDASTVRCTCGKLPLLVRRGMRVQDLRQIYELNEEALEVGYDAPYYETLFTNPHVVVFVALTTPEAYRAATSASSLQGTQDTTSNARDGEDGQHKADTLQHPSAAKHKAKDENNTTTSTNSDGFFSLDLEACQRRAAVEQFIAYKEYEAGMNSYSTQLNWLRSVARSGSQAVWHFLARLAGIQSACNTTQAETKATHTTTTTSSNNNTESDEAYTVVVGCITGFVSYAQYGEERWVCANPTGYIATFAVAQALRRSGVGSLLLKHCLCYMTQEMPLTMSAYLHYDEAEADALLNDVVHELQCANKGETTGSRYHTHLTKSDMKGKTGNIVLHRGVNEIWLNCIADSQLVVRFYTKRGFRVTRRMVNYYHIHDRDHDGLLLVYTRPDTTQDEEHGNHAALNTIEDAHNSAVSSNKDGSTSKQVDLCGCDMGAVQTELRRRFLGPLQQSFVLNTKTATTQPRRKNEGQQEDKQSTSHTRTRHVSHSTSSSSFYVPPQGLWLRAELYDAVQQVSCCSEELYRRIWQNQRRYQPEMNANADGELNMGSAEAPASWSGLVQQVVLTANAAVLLLLMFWVVYSLVAQ